MTRAAYIAWTLNASENSVRKENYVMSKKHITRIEDFIEETAPSGSGIDSGTKFDGDASNSQKLVFTFGYHHMDEMGGYDGWTEHKAVVRPCLMFGYNLKITGRDRNQIKDYLHQVYDDWLETMIETNDIHINKLKEAK